MSEEELTEEELSCIENRTGGFIQRWPSEVQKLWAQIRRHTETIEKLMEENERFRNASKKLIRRLEQLGGTMDRPKLIRVEDFIDEYGDLKRALKEGDSHCQE